MEPLSAHEVIDCLTARVISPSLFEAATKFIRQGHRDMTEWLLTAIYGHSPHELAYCDTKDEVARKRGDFSYVPLGVNHFLEVIRQLNPKSGQKFIDVGHGIGDKVFLAREVFDLDAYGVEYTPDSYYFGKFALQHAYANLGYPAAGRWACPLPITLYLGDAFEHNFAPYDIIYLYCPIADFNTMERLYNHILNTAKTGAKVVETFPSASEMLLMKVARERGFKIVYGKGHLDSYVIIKRK